MEIIDMNREIDEETLEKLKLLLKDIPEIRKAMDETIDPYMTKLGLQEDQLKIELKHQSFEGASDERLKDARFRGAPQENIDMIKDTIHAEQGMEGKNIKTRLAELEKKRKAHLAWKKELEDEDVFLAGSVLKANPNCRHATNHSLPKKGNLRRGR